MISSYILRSSRALVACVASPAPLKVALPRGFTARLFTTSSPFSSAAAAADAVSVADTASITPLASTSAGSAEVAAGKPIALLGGFVLPDDLRPAKLPNGGWRSPKMSARAVASMRKQCILARAAGDEAAPNWDELDGQWRPGKLHKARVARIPKGRRHDLDLFARCVIGLQRGSPSTVNAALPAGTGPSITLLRAAFQRALAVSPVIHVSLVISSCAELTRSRPPWRSRTRSVLTTRSRFPPSRCRRACCSTSRRTHGSGSRLNLMPWKALCVMVSRESSYFRRRPFTLVVGSIVLARLLRRRVDRHCGSQ